MVAARPMRAAFLCVLLAVTVDSFWVAKQSRGKLVQQQQRSRVFEVSSSSSSSEQGIPQLPAAASQTTQSSIPKANAPFVASKKFQIQYTCNICETRNIHNVSRIAYRKGVVISTCKGCESQHLIADNLGWTGHNFNTTDGSNNLEDHTTQRVTEEVFELERILHCNANCGSLVDENGDKALE